MSHPKNFKRVCRDCGKVEMIRRDHKHTRYCRQCALKATGIKPGSTPHNFGSCEGQVPRHCKVCGEAFTRSKSYMVKQPAYAWGSYCSRACYGIAQRTPGSRYSEVGKDYPSRRARR